MAKKANPEKVIPSIADEAMRRHPLSLQSRYSEYIRLYYQRTGKIACDIDNRDLMAYYANHY